MFIHSPRILSCLPTRSLLWLFPSFRPHSHTPSFVADLQVIAWCCYQQLQVRWQTEAVDSDWSGARTERSPPLYRGSCLQLRDGKRILWWSIVLLPACIKSASEKMGWNGQFSQCVRVWVRGRWSPASAFTCVCVKWSWNTTIDSQEPERSHSQTQDQDLLASVKWKLLCRGQIYNEYQLMKRLYACLDNRVDLQRQH